MNRFFFPLSSIILLSACGSEVVLVPEPTDTNSDASKEVPNGVLPGPNLDPQDPTFKPDVDSGVATKDASTTEDAGTTSDSGSDPALCAVGTKRTCEQSLHCCMDTCKDLKDAAGYSCSAATHVACVHACEEAHERCVHERERAKHSCKH